MTAPLPTLPVHAIQEQPDRAQWLVSQLWSASAVGVIRGVPKTAKSWLGLELAVLEPSGTAAWAASRSTPWARSWSIWPRTRCTPCAIGSLRSVSTGA